MKTAFLTTLLILSTACAVSQPGNADTLLAQQVFQRVLAVAQAPDDASWPPVLVFEKSSAVNAFARPGYTDGQRSHPASITLTAGMLEHVVEGDADRAAFVIGHELAHLTLGHGGGLLKRRTTAFTTLIYSRQDEFDADLRGAEYAAAAGFSHKRGMRALQKCIELGLEYSSFEGFGSDHPSWKERLAGIDREQAAIWNSMAAFDNGNYFLMVEQYLAAERCFRFVAAEFPSCAEAWANLGYALLMQYCDQLREEDIRAYGIGHIVTGGFYKRAYSLEYQMRGEADNEVWWQAVGALREALRLTPSSTLAKANLGIAYLVRPEGKDVMQATRFLQEAAEEASHDEGLDAMARMTILANAGVLEMSGDNTGKTELLFSAVDRLGKALAGASRRQFSASPLSRALDYNRGCLLGASPKREDKRRAAQMFERYLSGMPPSSAWWPLAYERYDTLCRALGTVPPTQADYIDRWQQRARFKPVVGVEEHGASLVQLAQSTAELDTALGPMTAIPVAGRAPIQRQVYASRNLELLVASGRVVMITLRASDAQVTVQRQGPGTERARVAVGMTRAQVEQALDGADSESRPRPLLDRKKRYDMYRSVGLAFLFESDVATEIVIANLQLN